MSYLLDRKIRKKNIIKYGSFLVILFFLIYWRAGIFRGLSYASSVIFHPVFTFGNNINSELSYLGTYFSSKGSLFAENQDLKLRLSEEESKMSNYNTILAENSRLKDVLGRKTEKKNMILAGILSKPDKSAYDTFILDAGSNNGISLGNMVFAFGNVPLGKVAEVSAFSSKVVLFSSPGEKTEVVIGDKGTFMQIVGRGGGNFEMILPRDFSLEKGTEAVLPGITPYTVGIVETIISDPRDAFQKVILASPVNIFELKFVEIEK